MKPNIVVFFTDQQRADTCGCYGQPLNTTPRLDEFAAGGTIFENTYTCQPVCGPARSAIQSGLYPTKTGCFRNGIALPEQIPTIAKQLDSLGYCTAYVGKWHLATTEGEENYETTPIPREKQGGYKDLFTASDVLEFTSHGYDGYVFDKDGKRLDFKGYRPDCITDYALDYINNYDSKKPYFVFISHIEPHHQNDRNCFEGPIGSKEKFKDFVVPKDLDGMSGNFMKEYPDYLGCVNSLDYNFGRILDAIEKRGDKDNTVVFFTSDHGSHFKTRNSEYKRSCHDSSIRIPFVVSGGDFSNRGRVESITSLIDLPQSILSVAGKTEPTFDGHDLSAVARGEQKHDFAYIEISEHHVGRAIRTNRYTYEIARPDLDAWNAPGAPWYEDLFLYDNFLDPAQQNNLINDKTYDEIKHNLRKIIADKIKQIEGKNVKILDKT